MNIRSVIKDNDSDWADRSQFWQDQTPKDLKPKTTKRLERAALILCGHGVRLFIERGTLRVQNGFTHHPQPRETWRFFPGKWQHPSRIVILDGAGSVSFEVLKWLEENDTPLVHIDWRGRVVQVTGGLGYSPDQRLVDLQRASKSGDHPLQIATQLVREKAKNTITTLSDLPAGNEVVRAAISQIATFAQNIEEEKPNSIDALLGQEGGLARAYFSAWRVQQIKWAAKDQDLMPADWHRVGMRISRISKKARKNRHATHPVNAMLNYAYAVLENQMRAAVVGQGLDPKLGYMHGNNAGKDGLVFDLMEPLRPVVDRMILNLVRNRILARADFTITREGECRLNPQLARMVVAIILTDLLIEQHLERFKALLLKHTQH
jgi:CRISPR-associated protein Cas1